MLLNDQYKIGDILVYRHPIKSIWQILNINGDNVIAELIENDFPNGKLGRQFTYTKTFIDNNFFLVSKKIINYNQYWAKLNEN